MRFLLPTGAITEPIVASIAAQFDADVIITGKIASFLRPKQLAGILERMKQNEDENSSSPYDCIFISGMCTASFEEVEAQFGIPIYRGPLHAADLAMILSYADAGFPFSRTIPADQLLTLEKEKEAYHTLSRLETEAQPQCYLRDLAIGGGSRIKVLAEIMDAHQVPDLKAVITSYVSSGADIIDLGFGFDAKSDDVYTVLSHVKPLLHEIQKTTPIACAIDTQDPDLITAALSCSCIDLVLSLHEENMHCAPLLRAHGVGAIIVPGEAGLEENMKSAQDLGIICIADPVLQPIGSGLLSSIVQIHTTHTNHPTWPLFFGAGNVIELIDADSIGAAAVLAGMAYEAGAGIIFISEHSDKTKGAISEMRRATEMMALLGTKPYPKDLGLDLFIIKEKRARREPPVRYDEMRTLTPPTDLIYDPKGNMRIGIVDGEIIVERSGVALSGTHWEELFRTIEAYGWVSRLDHAAYLGKELYKAELALRFKRSFEQDGEF